MTEEEAMELVEIVARGICRLKIAHNLERDGKPRGAAWRRTMEDAGWQYWTAEARAALTAIEASGRRIVPVEPQGETVPRMIEHGMKVSLSGDYTWANYMADLYHIALSASPKVTP